MAPTELALLARVAVGFALGYILGYERQLRGSPAGDRTFSLVGAAAAAITAVAEHNSPQTIAGVVTGIGFIGGGVVFRRPTEMSRPGEMISGITTAATIFAAAAVGIVVGFGHLWLGAVTTFGLLLTLELPHIPVLRNLDAHAVSGRFAKDPVWSASQPVAAPPQPEAGGRAGTDGEAGTQPDGG